ncbi:MAG: NADH-quinone oxidoreductase subunit K [Verrucomicrobiales bacterium]|nr:NADH-quinone oxidoreductase subunit K [Verrucomicrobiales bacterium]
MTAPALYALAGIALFGLGLHALIARAHLVAKILALNVMGAGVFMFLIAVAARGEIPDPVPHALVLTGIVVAVSATALALALALRVRAAGGRAELPEQESPDA